MRTIPSRYVDCGFDRANDLRFQWPDSVCNNEDKITAENSWSKKTLRNNAGLSGISGAKAFGRTRLQNSRY